MRLDMRVGRPFELDQYVRGGFLPGDTIGRATLRASGGSFIMPGHATQTQVVIASGGLRVGPYWKCQASAASTPARPPCTLPPEIRGGNPSLSLRNSRTFKL
jgi:hypothetical protein